MFDFFIDNRRYSWKSENVCRKCKIFHTIYVNTEVFRKELSFERECTMFVKYETCLQKILEGILEGFYSQKLKGFRKTKEIGISC